MCLASVIGFDVHVRIAQWESCRIEYLIINSLMLQIMADNTSGPMPLSSTRWPMKTTQLTKK